MGKRRKKLHPADQFRKLMRKRELKRNKGIRRTQREKNMARKTPAELQVDISKISRLEQLGQADEKMLVRKRKLEEARSVAIKKAAKKKPEPEPVVIKGWSKIFRRSGGSRITAAGKEDQEEDEDDLDEDLEDDTPSVETKITIAELAPEPAAFPSHFGGFSKEEEESMFFDDEEIEPDPALVDPAELETDSEEDSDTEPLLAAPPGLDAPPAPEPAGPAPSVPAAPPGPRVMVPGLGPTAPLGNVPLPGAPRPPLPWGAPNPMNPFFRPGMGRGMMPMMPMRPPMPIPGIPGMPPIPPPPQPLGPPGTTPTPPPQQAPGPSPAPARPPAPRSRGGFDPLDPNPSTNPLYAKRQQRGLPVPSGPQGPRARPPQGPTMPGRAVQGPAMPAGPAAVQGPSMPGAAVQGPSMPGQAVQGPSMPGQAVQGPSMPGKPEAKSSSKGQAKASTRSLPKASFGTGMVPTSVLVKRNRPRPMRRRPVRRRIVKPVSVEARQLPKRSSAAATEKALDSFLAEMEALENANV